MNGGARLVVLGERGERTFPVHFAGVVQVVVLLLVVANLGRIPVLSAGDRQAPILVNDLAVGLLLVVGASRMMAGRTLRVDRITLAGALFAAIGAAGVAASTVRYGLSGGEILVSVAYLARWLFYFGIFVVVTGVLRREQVGGVWRALETMLLIFAGFGIIQAIFIPGFAQLVYPDARLYTDWDPQGHRLVSTMLEPNLAGALLMIGLLVQLGRLVAGAPVDRWKLLLLFLALVLTLSRSAALGLIVGCIVIVGIRGLSKRMIRIAAVAGTLIVVALPALLAFGQAYQKFTLGGSAAVRVVMWLRALELFTVHPVLGVGFNAYGFVQQRRGYELSGASSFSTDGGLLFIAVLTGVVGLSVFVAMLVMIWRRCAKIWRASSATAEERGLAIGTAASIVAICVHSVFVNSLLTPFIMEPLWLLCASSVVIAYELGTDARAHPSRDRAVARLVPIA